MPAAFVVRLLPAGPWRIGPDSGERDRVESVLHSDALYSAVSSAMARMGLLDAWLADAFRNPQGPAVRFSSCFPFQDDTRFVTPPRTLWPPPPSLKVRWKGARFVPLQVVEELLAERPLDEESWRVDGMSRCLVPASRDQGPFRLAVRSNAGVDRLTGNTSVHRTACLEFAPRAGMWAVTSFASDEAETRWGQPVRAAFRLLADSGLGGERARGWGRFQQPEFESGVLPDLILGRPAVGGSEVEAGQGPAAASQPAAAEADRALGAPLAAAQGAASPSGASPAYWLLSVFTPAATDTIRWDGGNYSLLTRAGRVESPAAHGALKKLARMVAEGSVILSAAPPGGEALDVAPEGVPHPVYRAGFAFAVPIPLREVPR